MTAGLLEDRYQLGEVLGRGGMSVVHKARDLKLSRNVAVKLLRTDLARDPSFQARFRREAQSAGTLNDAAIVAVYDVGEMQSGTQVVPFIVLEYIEGDSLRDVLRRNGPPKPLRAIAIATEICAALDCSHRHGIVHQNINPGDVMIERTGAVKVMDFGITRGLSDRQPIANPAMIGSANYLSPEQVRGQPVDARTDVYATGCVLYEMLTGQPPFIGGSRAQIAHRQVRELPRPPSELAPGLPDSLDLIVLKALAKYPMSRYQSAGAMRADLQRAATGQAVLAGTDTSDGAPSGLAVANHEARVATHMLAGTSLLAEMDVPEWEQPRELQHRRHPGWALAGIGGLLLVAALAIWLTWAVISAPPAQALVAVPDLSGMTLSQATAELADNKLGLGAVTSIVAPQEASGKVVSQRPSGRTEVDQDSLVTLQIGTT